MRRFGIGAKAGDLLLFYFSGPGSRAPREGTRGAEDLLLYFPGPERKAEPGTLLAPAGDAQKLVVLDF